MQNISEEEETRRGIEIARVLMLKIAKNDKGKRYAPDRYNTTHGTKTALGLFRTLEYLIGKEDSPK